MKKIIYGALVALTAISLMACSGEKKIEKKTGGEDDAFASADEMEELYDKKLLNVTLDYVEYSVLLDESANDIIELDDFEEEMLYDCTVEKMFYESFS